ncbi:MAG: hypothetical protein J6N72_10705 [Psychrobacter sp.]|nr:hypothetical protein [Psychrobacter sp.]
MFRKKSSSSGNQGKELDNKTSFAYSIPTEDIDPNSDWGKPNFDNARSYTTQKRYKEMLDKVHLFFYILIGILLLVVLVMTFLLVFATEYEVAYVDDGTTLMCRVDN